MPRQNVNINFAQGLDTKTDPKQVSLGKFLVLENSIFTKGGLLTKRNGNFELPSLPEAATYSTTFNEDLTVIGSSIQALPTNSQKWVNKGPLQPLTTDVLPLIRNNLNQTQADSVVASNGFVCTVYTEFNGSSNAFKYVIADSTTGQNIVAPAVLNADATFGTPKVFLLGNYFIIVYAFATNDLFYVAISTADPTLINAPVLITTSYGPSASTAFDGTVLNNALYLVWNGGAGSGIKMAKLTATLGLSGVKNPDAAHSATLMTVTADSQNDIIWASYYDVSTKNGYSLAFDSNLNVLVNFPTQIIFSVFNLTVLNLASAAQSGTLTVFYEVQNTAGGFPWNYVASTTVDQLTGTPTVPVIVLRSVGLASKAFIVNGVIYFLAAFSSTFQPTYFLVNGSFSTSANPIVIGKIAYQNGGGYLTTGIPSVTVIGTEVYIAYLFKDLVEALSSANAAGTAVVGGVYSQTGINLVSFTLGSQGLVTSEIGTNLNITGGFLWAYDGYSITEQGFHLYPDYISGAIVGGGTMAAQIYFYVATYEWTDNQGNAFRSTGSIPIEINLTGGGINNNAVTLTINTLRVTQKIANPVKICIYRWSTAQQTFYQTTSITVPVLNNTTVDTVTFTDVNSDATILGNNILYTTGGVIEDTGAPGSSAMTLFDDRLWLVDAEDKNLLWFSKQVIEATPVEMSDLLTLYVAPTIGSQGSTGPMRSLGAMDDKLIIFKNNAIYYINGTGPDNTGANNQYSQPTFITSTVGCSNQSSIVFIPQGLMFQSDKGIWLLGRDLSTQYIGAPVEAFNSSLVQSSVNIPGENQVRFTLNTGTTLVYDYYYGQWSTFVNVPAVSSTLYQGLHTYINKFNQVFQESPGKYLDGTSPVLMNFTTSWLNLAGIQGYQRAFEFFLLGQYLTPFKLICSIAYDYESAPIQFPVINPTNFSPNYGSAEANGQNTVYGTDTPYGGPSKVLDWRVFLEKMRCSSIQISIQEIYDPSFGVPAGEGFNLSGINLVYAAKKGWRTISADHSTG